MSRIFKLISLCEKKKNIDNILETPIAIAGFKDLIDENIKLKF